jgi:nucleotide-binding universal stress UspA family protein
MHAILVATDGSQTAREAVAFATELARDAGATLHVVSVRQATFHGHGGPVQAQTDVHEVHGAQLIARAAAEAASAAGVRAEAHEAEGDEARAIAELAERLGVDLIVVGSHGHGPIGAALFGSVSRALVKRSRVPVTVVRAGQAAGAPAV